MVVSSEQTSYCLGNTRTAGKISQKQLDDAEDRSERAEKVIAAMQSEVSIDLYTILCSLTELNQRHVDCVQSH